MAATGHAGTHAPQSMHSSGWMYSIVACANSGSSLRGWMQSTGQTSTQAVSLVSIHGSVMMKGMLACLRNLEICVAATVHNVRLSRLLPAFAEPPDYTLQSRD